MTTPRVTTRLGWKPQLPDPRDKPYVCGLTAPIVLPDTFDLTSKFPPAYDQRTTNSCVAHACAGALQYEYRKQGLPDVTPSRLFIYWNTRFIEGTTSQDEGCCIRDAIKSIAVQGDCPEPEWPFIESYLPFKPSSKCYTDAAVQRVLSYETVDQTEEGIETCLFEGYPVIIGITAFQALLSDAVAKTGMVPMPGPNDAPIGGHGILITGFNHPQRMFKFRNSWSESWAIEGYGFLPYEYVLDPNLASDLWALKLVETPADNLPANIPVAQPVEVGPPTQA